MKITSLQFKNGYKRFHNLTIHLGQSPARVVALVGPNGCGKSSVLDGMLYHNNAHGALGNTGDMDYSYHSLHNEPNYSHQNISINFTEGTFSEVWRAKQQSDQHNTIFSFRSPYRYNANVKISETTAVDEIRLNRYGASTTVALDEKMEINYRRLLATYSEYRDDHDLKPTVALKRIIGELNTALANCLDISIFSLGEVQRNQGTIYFARPDQPQPFEYNVLSAGEKEVVDILSDLYLRQGDYNDTIFLIDEPELHINAAIQRKLFIEINNLVGNSCQIWVATHSIGFLRTLQEELNEDCQIIYFEPGTDFGKSAQTLEPIPETHSNWRKVFGVALDDLTGLTSPKSIIYCEGKAERRRGEEQGTDAQVYNNIFGEEHSDTLFVSSGGNTEPEQRASIALEILKKALVDVDILVLKDRDFASGKATTEEDREHYLQTNPDYHRVLTRWEMENFLYDKEVLMQYTSEKGLVFNETKYDKNVRDIANQTVKDETGMIKSVCGITWSVNAEKFKVELSQYIKSGLNVYEELRECIFYEREK